MVLSTSTNGTLATAAWNRFRAQIEHRANQQAAGAAAQNGHPRAGSVAFDDQIPGAGDEIREAVFLVSRSQE